MVHCNTKKTAHSIDHWGETGLANAGVSLSKMDAAKVGEPVFCSFAVFYHTFRASHSPMFLRVTILKIIYAIHRPIFFSSSPTCYKSSTKPAIGYPIDRGKLNNLLNINYDINIGSIFSM